MPSLLYGSRQTGPSALDSKEPNAQAQRQLRSLRQQIAKGEWRPTLLALSGISDRQAPLAEDLVRALALAVLAELQENICADDLIAREITEQTRRDEREALWLDIARGIWCLLDQGIREPQDLLAQMQIRSDVLLDLVTQERQGPILRHHLSCLRADLAQALARAGMAKIEERAAPIVELIYQHRQQLTTAQPIRRLAEHLGDALLLGGPSARYGSGRRQQRLAAWELFYQLGRDLGDPPGKVDIRSLWPELREPILARTFQYLIAAPDCPSFDELHRIARQYFDQVLSDEFCVRQIMRLYADRDQGHLLGDGKDQERVLRLRSEIATWLAAH